MNRAGELLIFLKRSSQTDFTGRLSGEPSQYETHFLSRIMQRRIRPCERWQPTPRRTNDLTTWRATGRAESGPISPIWAIGNRSTTCEANATSSVDSPATGSGRGLAETRRAALGMQLRWTPSSFALAGERERQAAETVAEIDWSGVA